MRLSAALAGTLREQMAAELAAGERAVTQSIRAATLGAQADLRAQTSLALGNRVARAWRKKVYPASGVSMQAAGIVWTRAQAIVLAHANGAVIKSQDGRFLSIPTPAAGKGFRGAKITPGEWERRHGQRLRFVYRPNAASLLVADGQRARAGKRGGFSRAGKRAVARGETVTVVMFLLVPQVRLKKRIDMTKIEESWHVRVADMIERIWDREARHGQPR